MSSPHDTCHGRSFSLALEDLPPRRRFLFAANPPSRAGSGDVRALVTKSYGLRYSDVPGMCHYARLASTLAGALRLGDPDLQDAKGEAWMQHGNVLRIFAHFRDSQRSLATAEEELSEGSLRPDLQALLWELRGSLYRDWRKFSLADPCLAIALDYHSHAGHHDDANRCLVARAMTQGYGGSPALAVSLAERAVQGIDPAARPDLAVAAIQALCWFLVDCGDPKRAIACYVDGEPLFNRQTDELVQIHRSWLRGHIDNALGLFSSAETLYRRAAAGFAKHDLAFDRALVLLDLCMPLAEQDQAEELADVAAEILPEFERIGIGREALASRLLLSAARRATIANRLKGLRKVSRLVQRTLPWPRKLPEL
jgi:tetratricopeptide (TPR) repeat protein